MKMTKEELKEFLRTMPDSTIADIELEPDEEEKNDDEE